PLDIPAMREAARFLLGTHDFSTFRSPHAESQSPVRTLRLLQLQPGRALLGQHGLHRAGLVTPGLGLSHWGWVGHTGAGLVTPGLGLDLSQAGSWLAEPSSPVPGQVRRMVGALVAVGQGRLAPRQLQELLQLRDPRALPPHAVAPASGLFLHSVEYSQADLATPSAPAEEELCEPS
ncbi:tRNA pseudouridine synthase-like 1, partial [Pyrgilauda ruficollis]|uniref:tRNA pseudouridine synthase-like 1 n=1 Tax=Pyrgilauda ruficollis TaxID=221976 RepID=UPI001B870656